MRPLFLTRTERARRLRPLALPLAALAAALALSWLAALGF